MADQQTSEINLRAAERAHDEATEIYHRFNEAAMRDAQAAIRIVLAINGGAAVAVLAFTGSLASRSVYPLQHLSEVISHSLWFVIGALTAAFAALFSYLTNFCYAGASISQERAWEFPYLRANNASKWYKVAGYTLHILAILVALAGMVLFVIGMFKFNAAFRFIVSK